MPKLSLAKLERHLYAAADRLRQEGLDAATYKDYIFGLLFLKRFSDVFDAEREKIPVERQEDPDYYDTFFVPERARWAFLQSKLADATEQYGNVLDKALGALAEANDSLEHVLDHIQFMRIQSNKRIVSDDACKDLVRHFSRYRLRNEDFQFADLLGSAYEFLINMFAESAGKKGGDFYTPRDVIRLMVRILKPQPGMSVYDPTCGSGGMLIISREFIEQSGGDVTNVRLCGQVNDASAWSICKLNMLLHGVPGADIQLQDTLLHPMHREAGELERFDRVIANPPFSQNYTRTNMEFQERFRWGWAPTTGKKADLMFAQHMLAVCKPNGLVTTVMPNGVLFRGAEKDIRKKFLEQDLIEAIVGLPTNLFYGASIPACIVVMRPNLAGQKRNPNKPANRCGRILFINADAEFHAGRAQNYLRPEHVEKIVSTYHRFEDVPGYARCVDLEEIGDETNDWSLNIRRYVDNSPPPEPQDVRSHIVGVVPVAEVESKRSLYHALGFDSAQMFVTRMHDSAFLDFAPFLTERPKIRARVENDPGICDTFHKLSQSFHAWWTTHADQLGNLPTRRNLNAVRSEFLQSFAASILPLTILDHFTLSGVVATWWTDTLPDFKTLLEHGFPGVIDGWVDAIVDALEDEEAVRPVFDPFSHKLTRHIMADYLSQLSEAKTEMAQLRVEKDAFEQTNATTDLEDEEDTENWNYAKDLERQEKDVRASHKEALKKLATLEKVAAKPKATSDQKSAALASRQALQPVFSRLTAIESALAPYVEITTQLAAARSRYRQLTGTFVQELKSRVANMADEDKRTLVLDLFAGDLNSSLEAALTENRRELLQFLEGLWDKYRTTLGTLKQNRCDSEIRLEHLLRTLNYA